MAEAIQAKPSVGTLIFGKSGQKISKYFAIYIARKLLNIKLYNVFKRDIMASYFIVYTLIHANKCNML